MLHNKTESMRLHEARAEMGEDEVDYASQSSDDEFEPASDGDDEEEDAEAEEAPPDNEAPDGVAEAHPNAITPSVGTYTPLVRGARNGERGDVSFGPKKRIYARYKQLKDSGMDIRDVMRDVRIFAASIGVRRVWHQPQLRSWGTSSKSGGKRKRSKRRTDNLTLSALDDAVKVWVTTRRDLNAGVTKNSIMLEACEFLKDPLLRRRCKGQQTVSMGWVDRFMARTKLVSKNAKRRTALTAVEITERADKFQTYIYRCLDHVDAVINIDEIPTSLSGNMSGKVNHATDEDVRIGVDATAFKRCATVIAGAMCVRTLNEDGSGTWISHGIPPIVILKGDPVQKRVLDERYADGAVVVWSKCGVVSGKIMKETVLPHLRRQANALELDRVLLVMDSASAHLTQEVTTKAWSMSLPVAIVPGGCTSYMQWIDTHFAGKFKHHHFAGFGPLRPERLTAQMKRKLLVRLVIASYRKALSNVTEEFRRLGYTDPEAAEIRGIPQYKFRPPVLNADELEYDAEAMAQRIRESASAELTEPSPTPRRPLGRQRPPLRPPPGYGQITRYWPLGQPAPTPRPEE